MKLSELIAEAKIPKATKGFLAVVDPESVFNNVEGVFAFRDSNKAQEFYDGLDKELEDSDGYANNEYTIDGFHLVFHCDHRADLDEMSIVAFGTNKEKLEKRMAKELQDGDLYGVEDLSEVDFIETNG